MKEIGGGFDIRTYLKKITVYFLLMVFSFNIHAQDKESVVMELEDEMVMFFKQPALVPSTTKREESTLESAFNIRVIYQEEINKLGFQTLSELFMFLENSFAVSKGVDRVYGVRGIVGYANDKIKYLIDGMELPMMLGLGEGELPVTLDEVKKIEIIKGPNTSIFGGNSTQATINIIRYNGADFQGFKSGVTYGKWDHAGLWFHYAEKPTEDFDYDIYFNTVRQDGYNHYHHAYWHFGEDYADQKGESWNAHNRNIPTSDYELVTNFNYKNLRFIYRKVESAVSRFHRYIRNYSTAMAFEYNNKNILFEGLDFILNFETSDFGQQYDSYHVNDQLPSYYRHITVENKRESRLEWDASLHYHALDNWDILLGIGGNNWHAEGGEWGGYKVQEGEPPIFPYSVNLEESSVTDEYFPSFTEINDLANFEYWVDFKYIYSEKLNFVFGGRYVYDYTPEDQLRDSDSLYAMYRTDRVHLRDFFSRVAMVYMPKERLALKLLYQEGYNRPNTFEQFSMQTNVARRGTIKSTTAKTYELVLDYTISDHLKTLISFFDTKLNDFTNFVYTGTSFPSVSEGELIGFHNVGTKKIRGVEINLEAKYQKYGTILNFGYLLKNKITPDAIFDPNTNGQTAATGMIDNSDNNQQTYPEWTIGLGVWVEVFENTTCSLLYKRHNNVKNNFSRDNYELDFENLKIDELNYTTLDFTVNVKDFIKQGLNLQFIAQNITNERDLIGDALSPVHAEQTAPSYFQIKLTYLWK